MQNDLVRIGFDPVSLPTGYWTRPINIQNREWYAISGSSFDPLILNGYNPYTTGPESSHVLWKRQAAIGGIAGGTWGGISAGGGGPAATAIMFGRIYFNTGAGTFACQDLRTGEILWEKTGSINKGEISFVSNILGTGIIDVATGYLWGYTTSAWTRYDAFTGAVSQTISTGVLVTPGVWLDDFTGYSVRQGGWSTTTNRLAYNELIKWNISKITGGNWSTGIEWRVSMKQPDGTGPGEGGRTSSAVIVNGAVCVGSPLEDRIYAYDVVTGKQLWVHQLPFPNPHNSWAGPFIYDSPQKASKFVIFDSATMILYCYDISNWSWKELWTTTEAASYPWGSCFGQFFSAYGMVYTQAYDGHVRAFNLDDGKLVWDWYVGSTSEYAFGTWPFRNVCVIGDGKVYVSNFEHSPTQPMARGNKVYCIDAYAGKGIWNISNWVDGLSLVEGYLVGTSKYDGYQYCFGKGQTAVDVTISTDVVAKGNSVLIKGTVTDQSPAQAGTPAVSEESMTPWMNYLHAQASMPTDVKGVPVTLTATAPDGTCITIGETTSDGYGNFAYLWAPPNTGIYMVQATFAGSTSYWSSTAETQVGVVASVASPSVTGPAQTESPTQTSTPTQSASPSASTSASSSASSPSVAPPPSTEAAPSMTLYIAIAAAVIVIAVAAVALVIRKRK